MSNSEFIKGFLDGGTTDHKDTDHKGTPDTIPYAVDTHKGSDHGNQLFSDWNHITNPESGKIFQDFFSDRGATEELTAHMLDVMRPMTRPELEYMSGAIRHMLKDPGETQRAIAEYNLYTSDLLDEWYEPPAKNQLLQYGEFLPWLPLPYLRWVHTCIKHTWGRNFY